ncbi:MAG TPA: ATP-binding protein [Actinomycetota bacterium]|nr:ATP-binding protein [Actinomycetota bacterium]
MRWSVRARATASAVAIVGTALICAAVSIVLTIHRSSEENIRSAARLRVQDFVALLESGNDPSDLDIRFEPGVFVQVVDESGRVVAASPQLEGLPPAAQIGTYESATVDNPRGGREPFLVVSDYALTESEDLRVLVGRSVDVVAEATRVLITALAIAVPLLLAIVGVATWMMVGRSLAPVEAIRAEVAAISGSELHRRVPDPPGDDEVARLARTMNHMLERLEEAQLKQRRLVADASHEFRNPLAAIRQHAELALAHPGQATAAELAGDVLPESLRLQHIAEDLLLLARADEDALALKIAPLDMKRLVLEEAARLESVTSMTVDTSGVEEAEIAGDSEQLHRLVRNLTDNAARYASSTVGLALRAFDGHVLLHVDDDGPGIPVDRRRSVFERFSRLDEARGRRMGGAGLGLAIVPEIVGANGGSVAVSDAPLGGARFEITLPRK